MDMPNSWNDSGGWDSYYLANPVKTDDLSSYEIGSALRFFRAAEGKQTWIAGCGLDPAVWLYANLGCSVYASDLSPVAVRMQTELMKSDPFAEIDGLAEMLDEAEVPTARNFVSAEIECADFTRSIPDRTFDLILNVRAFQGLSPEDMKKAGRNFFRATREGGSMLVSTQNVQGEHRNQIENALHEAGFLIPNREAEQWYRNKLEATGIVYAMVLGRPIIPQWGQYKEKGGEAQRAKDQVLLRSFGDEYRERMKQNYEEDKKRYRPEIDKIAQVIYNTG